MSNSENLYGDADPRFPAERAPAGRPDSIRPADGVPADMLALDLLDILFELQAVRARLASHSFEPSQRGTEFEALVDTSKGLAQIVERLLDIVALYQDPK